MFDIVGKRNYFFALSILLIIVGIIAFIVNGVQLDIQFQGGTIIRVQMSDDNFDEVAIADALSSSLGKTVSTQKSTTFNPENASDAMDMIVIKVASHETLTGEELNKVYEILQRDFGVSKDAQTDVQSVAPFMGREMLGKGLRATLTASVLIIIYTWWRFSAISGFSAAIAGIIALLHDVVIMFAIYPIFGLPINESFVAAVLTILGYSMNDTIIIYDRIRENRKLMKKLSSAELVNLSIIQTLTRSINTLVTTLLCVLVVYIFACVNNITSIKEFTLPLLVGLISGAYSSIFIAGPLWMLWEKSRETKKVSRRARSSKTR